jgi:hypothetical protein
LQLSYFSLVLTDYLFLLSNSLGSVTVLSIYNLYLFKITCFTCIDFIDNKQISPTPFSFLLDCMCSSYRTPSTNHITHHHLKLSLFCLLDTALELTSDNFLFIFPPPTLLPVLHHRGLWKYYIIPSAVYSHTFILF